jgi:Lysylphosphatidylglycerol synthase TM region
MSRQGSGEIRRWRRPWRLLGPLAAIAIAILAISPLARLTARMVAPCARWAVIAGLLELLSILGFLLIFKLVFAARVGWRRSLPAGLRGLAASTLLPAGALIGPVAAARSAHDGKVPTRIMTRSAITFVILTGAPGVLVLGVLGPVLWAGWVGGPHEAVLTLLPGAIAIAVTATTWLAALSCKPSQMQSEDTGPPGTVGRGDTATGAIRGGAAEACRLLAAPNWQLAGAVGYYAFDNAVLWAAFEAYGHTPHLSVVVMGYLVGSLAGSLPLPAGLGVLEGGMIGALILYGAHAAPAAAAVLLYRVVSLSVPLALGALSLGDRCHAARA